MTTRGFAKTVPCGVGVEVADRLAPQHGGIMVEQAILVDGTEFLESDGWAIEVCGGEDRVHLTEWATGVHYALPLDPATFRHVGQVSTLPVADRLQETLAAEHEAELAVSELRALAECWVAGLSLESRCPCCREVVKGTDSTTMRWVNGNPIVAHSRCAARTEVTHAA